MTNTGLVHHTVCLFASQLSLVITAPNHEGMARLSWPESWLHAEMVYQSADGHPSKYLPGPALINSVDATKTLPTTPNRKTESKNKILTGNFGRITKGSAVYFYNLHYRAQKHRQRRGRNYYIRSFEVKPLVTAEE